MTERTKMKIWTWNTERFLTPNGSCLVFDFFSHEQIMHSCHGCFGVSMQEAGILMQVRELQGKYLQTETFQNAPLPKGICKNLGSKWRKPQTDWLFWNALQWIWCSSGRGMKPGTGPELVSWEVMGFGWDMSLFCCYSPVSSAEHFLVLLKASLNAPSFVD